MQGTPTRHTFPHVGAHGRVVGTGTGEFRRVLGDHRGGQAQKLTTAIHTVSLSAPVCTYKERKVGTISIRSRYTASTVVVCYDSAQIE